MARARGQTCPLMRFSLRKRHGTPALAGSFTLSVITGNRRITSEKFANHIVIIHSVLCKNNVPVVYAGRYGKAECGERRHCN